MGKNLLVRIPSRFLLHQGILFATILLVNYCTEVLLQINRLVYKRKCTLSLRDLRRLVQVPRH
jgi:hypothetical protein